MKIVLLILIALLGFLVFIIEQRNKAYNKYLTNKKLCLWETDDDEHYVTSCGENRKYIGNTYKPVYNCPNCKKPIKIIRTGIDE